MKYILIGLLFIFSGGQVTATEYQFPALTGHVVDTANEIPDDQEAKLDKELIAFEKSTGHQLVVVTIPDLNGADVKDYTLNLGRQWKLGRKGLDDGIILFQSPGDGSPGSGKIRIEVGYGLEYILTDYATAQIQQDIMIPILKQDRPRSETTPEALIAGAHELMRLGTITPEQKADSDHKAAEEAKQRNQLLKAKVYDFLLSLAAIFVLAILAWIGWFLVTFKSRKKKREEKEAADLLIAQQNEERRRRIEAANLETQRKYNEVLEENRRKRERELAAMTPEQRLDLLRVAESRRQAIRIQEKKEEHQKEIRRQKARDAANTLRNQEIQREQESRSHYSDYSSPSSSSSSSSSSSDDSWGGGGGGDFGGGGSDTSY